VSFRPDPNGHPADALLLVAHGSASPEAQCQVSAIERLVAGELPGVTVKIGYLELADPPAGPVLDDLAAGGARRIVVLPLMLLGAGHAKSDVPALVLEGRERHPGLDIRFGSPLGLGRDLVAILGDAVLKAGGGGLPFLLIARGTSDPDANGDAAKAARLLAEWTGAPFVHTGFTGVVGPRVPEALDVFARLGHQRIATAFWFLCTGKLVDRALGQLADFSARTDVEVVDGGYFGAHPGLVPVIVERYRRALDGAAPAVNCDLCAYRAPWPGREDRLGRPVGVGHSHHAAEHRRGDGHRH
jgi:sirohydrochlorin ferrochelatase